MRLLHVFISGTSKPIGLLAVTDEMADAINSSDGLAARLYGHDGLYVKVMEPIDDEEAHVAARDKHVVLGVLGELRRSIEKTGTGKDGP